MALCRQAEIVCLDSECIFACASADGEIAQTKCLQAIGIQSDHVSMIASAGIYGEGFCVEEGQGGDILAACFARDLIGFLTCDNGIDGFG